MLHVVLTTVIVLTTFNLYDCPLPSMARFFCKKLRGLVSLTFAFFVFDRDTAFITYHFVKFYRKES